MILGVALMLIGGLLVLRNRKIAIFLGREPKIDQWGFMTSFIRQNIALFGMIFLIGGLVFFAVF